MDEVIRYPSINIKHDDIIFNRFVINKSTLPSPMVDVFREWARRIGSSKFEVFSVEAVLEGGKAYLYVSLHMDSLRKSMWEEVREYIRDSGYYGWVWNSQTFGCSQIALRIPISDEYKDFLQAWEEDWRLERLKERYYDNSIS